MSARVWIEDGCIGCAICVEVCPQVFVLETVARVVREDVPESAYPCVKEAARECPAGVIKHHLPAEGN